MIALLLAACAGKETEGRVVTQADSDRSAPARSVEFDARVLHGTVDRGAFVGTTHVVVQLEDAGAFLYRVADGMRRELDVSSPSNRWRPQVQWSAAISGDRVAVYDFQNRQLTEFDTAGTVIHSTSLSVPKASPSPVAMFADGGLLVLRDVMPSPYAQETGAYADTTALMPVTAELEARGPDIPVTRSVRVGEVDDSLRDDVDRSARSVGAVNEGVFDGQGRRSVGAWLSPGMRIAPTPERAYVGFSDSATIRVIAPDGSERGRFPITSDRRGLSEPMRARLREQQMRDVEPKFRALYSRLPMPDQTPYYDRLLGDAEGRLWVERYPLPGDPETVWTVYQPDGGRIGSLSLPAGVRLLDATRDRLLIARPGALGSSRVQIVPYVLK